MSKPMAFTGQALKNLFSKPATTSYPFEPKNYPERTRGHVEINESQCILCGMCMRSCPPGAIKVDRAGLTWEINGYDCVQCGYCVSKCPKKCLSIVPGYTEPGPEKLVKTVNVPEPPKPAPKPAAPAAPAAPKPAEVVKEAVKAGVEAATEVVKEAIEEAKASNEESKAE